MVISTPSNPVTLGLRLRDEYQHLHSVNEAYLQHQPGDFPGLDTDERDDVRELMEEFQTEFHHYERAAKPLLQDIAMQAMLLEWRCNSPLDAETREQMAAVEQKGRYLRSVAGEITDILTGI